MSADTPLATALADRYRIERELGQGGMAIVYLAEDVRHHRRVAIKVLHPQLSAVIGSERFLKEIELTANLQHAHPPPKKIKIDYILLSHNPKVDISRLQDFFIYEQLVFDGSNSAFQRRKWKNACNELPLRCFSVPEQGAFVVNL